MNLAEDEILLKIVTANVKGFFRSRGKVIFPTLATAETKNIAEDPFPSDSKILDGTELTEQGARRVIEFQLEDTPILGLKIAMAWEIFNDLKCNPNFLSEGLSFQQAMDLSRSTVSQLWLATTYLESIGVLTYIDGRIYSLSDQHILQSRA